MQECVTRTGIACPAPLILLLHRQDSPNCSNAHPELGPSCTHAPLTIGRIQLELCIVRNPRAGIMTSLDPGNTAQLGVCVNVACPGEPGASMSAWTPLQVGLSE